MKLYQRKRVTTIIRQLYRVIFAGNKRKILAAEAVSMLTGGSAPTIILARKAALCKSVRIAGRWYWLRPKRDIAQALEYIKKRRQNTDNNAYRLPTDNEYVFIKSAVDSMKRYFAQNNFCVPALEMRSLLHDGLHIPRRGKIVSTARRELEIKDLLIDRHRYWLYAGEEVQDWLIELLNNGPVEADKIFSLAAEKKWRSELIWRARLKAGGIETKHKDGKVYWYDINADSGEKPYTPPAASSTPAPERRPSAKQSVSIPGLERH